MYVNMAQKALWADITPKALWPNMAQEAQDIQEQIDMKLHKTLVATVKEFTSSHKFMNDAWMNYTHDNAHLEKGHRSITLDPWKYSSPFLVDFLKHAVGRKKDKRAIEDFLERPLPKKQRTTYVDAPRYREITQVWIVVGDDVLHGNERFECRHVALPSNLVHHSGVAISMVLSSMNDQLVDNCLNVKIADGARYNCLHCEGKFRKLPYSETQSPHEDRIDNINNCFRAWGVDAKATTAAMKNAVRSSIHPGLQHFVAVGSRRGNWRQCFHIDPSSYVAYLAETQRKVLHDSLLVEEVCRAQKGEKNGITLWNQRATPGAIADILKHYGAHNPHSLVLVLSPGGTLLTRDTSYARSSPHDIWWKSQQ